MTPKVLKCLDKTTKSIIFEDRDGKFFYCSHMTFPFPYSIKYDGIYKMNIDVDRPKKYYVDGNKKHKGYELSFFTVNNRDIKYIGKGSKIKLETVRMLHEILDFSDISERITS